MGEQNEEELKVRFFKILANVPDKIRSEDIIVVVDEKPYTWNAAAIEVKNGTKVGQKIMRILKEEVKIL